MPCHKSSTCSFQKQLFCASVIPLDMPGSNEKRENGVVFLIKKNNGRKCVNMLIVPSLITRDWSQHSSCGKQCAPCRIDNSKRERRKTEGEFFFPSFVFLFNLRVVWLLHKTTQPTTNFADAERRAVRVGVYYIGRSIMNVCQTASSQHNQGLS